MTASDASPLVLQALAAPGEGAEFCYVRMRDGVGLATDVYLPRRGGRSPTILTRVPYDKSHAECGIPHQVAPYFCERGYAVVAQDTRGKIRSEGITEAFVNEARDGYDALEWIRQQPWSDGRVGMWGESYFGFTQWAAAASGHDALKALAPRNTAASIGDGWFYRQGVFELLLGASWAASSFSHMQQVIVTPAQIPWNERPLRDIVRLALGIGSRSFDCWSNAGEFGEYWRMASTGGYATHSEVVIPTFHIGGWFDCFRHGQIRDWTRLQGRGSAVRRLLMKSVDHAGATRPWSIGMDGGLSDPDQYMHDRPGVLAEQLDETIGFYDEALKGSAATATRPVRVGIMGGDEQEFDTWPPSGSSLGVLFLTDDGRVRRLVPEGRDSAQWSRWIHDPARCIPTTGGEPFLRIAVPPDDRSLSERDDAVVFDGQPLREPLTLMGAINADLAVGTDGPSLHVVVKLIDVFPDGSTRRVIDGAAWIRELDGDGEGRVIVDLGHTAYRVATGHRLRMAVSSSDFPRYLPHPGTDENPWTAVRTVVNRQRLRTGGRGGSRLLFQTLKPR